MGITSTVDQDWLKEEIFPQYELAGLKAIITIPSKSALSRLSSNLYQQTGRDFGIAFLEVESLAEALEKAGECFKA